MIIGQLLYAVLWIIITLIAITPILMLAKRAGAGGLIGIYVGLTIIATICATKIVSLVGLTVAGGTIIYSVTYLVTDLLSECYSKKDAETAVHAGILGMLLYFFYSYIVLKWPAPPFWNLQNEFEVIISLSGRISIAGLVAFYVSQRTDILIFHFLKKKHGSDKLWLRNIASTTISQAVDSVIFTIIAFWGVMPVLPIMTGVYLIKVLVALMDTPLVYIGRSILGTSNSR